MALSEDNKQTKEHPFAFAFAFRLKFGSFLDLWLICLFVMFSLFHKQPAEKLHVFSVFVYSTTRIKWEC